MIKTRIRIEWILASIRKQIRLESLILSFHLHYNLHYFIKQTRSIVQDKTNTHIHIYITRLFSKASLWPRSLLEQHKSRTVIKVTSVATFERGIIRNRRDGGDESGGRSLGLKATRLISNYEAKIRGIPDIGGPRYRLFGSASMQFRGSTRSWGMAQSTRFASINWPGL